MSRKSYSSLQDLDMIYEDLDRDTMKRKDKRKRNLFGKERRFKFSRREHQSHTEALIL